LFVKRDLILGIKGSFLESAEGLGGEGGLSLKNTTISIATTVHRMAWHRSEWKISSLAYCLFIGNLSESATKNDGITNPTATPKGFDAVAIVVAMTLYSEYVNYYVTYSFLSVPLRRYLSWCICQKGLT
jgi:hypothetical protein